MKNYFTFFLCARDWGRVEDVVFPVVEKVLEALPSSGKINATAQLKSDTTQDAPRILSGSYGRVRRELQPEDLAKLILRVAGKTPDVHEFFLYFERTRYKYTPEYLRFISARTPERVEAGGELKIFSFSIGRDLFERKMGDAERSALRGAVERLFVDASCEYGFGHPTAWHIASPYQFVRDSSPQAGLQRIVDFDYASQIEDVYVYNYLSESHLREIAALDALCKATPVAECKRLYDDLRRPRGLALYFKDTSAETLHAVAADYLHSLIPAPAPPLKSFQLLLQGARCDAAARNALGNYSFAGQVTELPDFIRVELKEAVSADDNKKFYSELNEFFERLRPGLLRGGLSVAQYIVQYHGLFDPHQIFQRLPARSFEQPSDDAADAKLFVTSDVRLARLNLLFLINAGLAGEPLARLGDMVRDWLSALRRHPAHYGRVNVIEAFRPVTIEDRVHAETVIDATHLKQDGLNLLMLMLDEANRNEFVVPYLVCGDLPPGFVNAIAHRGKTVLGVPER
jgi:hypothetical protein